MDIRGGWLERLDTDCFLLREGERGMRIVNCLGDYMWGCAVRLIRGRENESVLSFNGKMFVIYRSTM